MNKKLSAALKKSGMTRADVAKGCGASASAVRRWVAGDAMPTPAQLKRLESLIGKSARDLGYRIASAPVVIPDRDC